MKLHKLALAACVLAAGSAHALTPAQIDTFRGDGSLKEIHIAGASALRLALGAAVQDICDAASFDVFFDSTAGSNHRAYSCLTSVAVGSYPVGTKLLVTKRDAGGSARGVTQLATNPPTPQEAILVTAAGATPCTPTGATLPLTIKTPSYLCTGTVNKASDAGISDVEPAMLQQTINRPDGVAAVDTSTLTVGSLVQGIFAPAVNNKLYFALQRAQFPAETAGKTIADIDTLPQPSLSTEFIRSVLTGQITGSTGGNKGWNVVVPASVDPQVSGKTVNICRRTEGSGTQAASNIYFANNPCGGALSGLTPSGVTGSSGGTTGTLSVRTGLTAVQEGASSGNVETCLATVDAAVVATDPTDNAAYGLAIIGRENDPVSTNKSYRFVKLDGVAPLRNEAKVGNYPMVYDATMQWNTAYVGADAAKLSFLTALRNNTGRSSALAALDVSTHEGVMALPGTYTGPYLTMQASSSASAAEKAFGSRVSRLAGNSCSPIRIIK